MKRKSIPRRWHTHEAIIQAAAERFAAHGYDRTSMDMIAEAAGVSRQTIYNRFESKEALLRALVDTLVAELIAPLDRLQAGAPLQETLQAFGEHALAFVLSPRTIGLQHLAAETAHIPGFSRIVYDAGPARAHEVLAAYLSTQARLGHLEMADPLLAATHFFALVTRDSELKALFNVEGKLSKREIKKRTQHGVALFLRAYAPSRQSQNHPAQKTRRT